MTKLFKTIINRNNCKKHNSKYIKIGDEKLWKVFIEK